MWYLAARADETLESGRQASRAISLAFDELWQQVLRGSLFEVVADVGILLAVLSLGLFLLNWGKGLMEGEENQSLASLIWPLIVIMFLSNNAALLAESVLTLRNVVSQVNDEVLAQALQGEDLQATYQQALIDAAYEEVLQARLVECDRLTDLEQQQTCTQQAIAAARSAGAEAAAEAAENEELGFFGSTAQSLLKYILLALHSGYQWVVEIVLLLTALISPLALGLSLLPTPSRPIIGWISGFLALALAKLCFNLISALAAFMSATPYAGYSALVLPVVLGLFAPVLSVFVGLQGGLALFQALASLTIYKSFGAARMAFFSSTRMLSKAIRALLGRRSFPYRR